MHRCLASDSARQKVEFNRMGLSGVGEIELCFVSRKDEIAVDYSRARGNIVRPSKVHGVHAGFDVEEDSR